MLAQDNWQKNSHFLTSTRYLSHSTNTNSKYKSIRVSMSVDSTNCLDLPETYEADKRMVPLGMKADIFPRGDRRHDGAVSDCLQYPDLDFYCDCLRAIPPNCLWTTASGLSVHLPVQNFISSAFPSHSNSLVVQSASKTFSDNPPNEALASLVGRDIPPKKFIEVTKSLFGQGCPCTVRQWNARRYRLRGGRAELGRK